MTELSQQRMVGLKKEINTLPALVAADAVIYKGALCGFKGGYLYQWQPDSGLAHPCIAILDTAQTVVDNTDGDDGDLSAIVEFLDTKKCYLFVNDSGSPITQEHIGGSAFGLDDQTVSASSGSGARARVGTPWIVQGSNSMGYRTGVYVELVSTDPQGDVLDLLADVPNMQAVDATLASGTITINTGIVVATATEVIPVMIGTIAGSTNFAGLRELKASRVNGAAGVGTVVIEAVSDAGGLDNDAAGAIRVVLLTPQ